MTPNGLLMEWFMALGLSLYHTLSIFPFQRGAKELQLEFPSHISFV